MFLCKILAVYTALLSVHTVPRQDSRLACQNGAQFHPRMISVLELEVK